MDKVQKPNNFKCYAQSSKSSKSIRLIITSPLTTKLYFLSEMSMTVENMSSCVSWYSYRQTWLASVNIKTIVKICKVTSWQKVCTFSLAYYFVTEKKNRQGRNFWQQFLITSCTVAFVCLHTRILYSYITAQALKSVEYWNILDCATCDHALLLSLSETVTFSVSENNALSLCIFCIKF
jgi:hypothetical protein